MHADFVLGNPPGRHAEFLGNKHRRISLFEREEFDFVELEGTLVAVAVERRVVAAEVDTHRTFAAGLHPHENAVVLGEIATLGLAVSQKNLDAGVRIGVALLQFVVDNDGGIGTRDGDRRGTPVRAVRFGNDIGVVGEVQEDNFIKPILVREKGYDRSSQ